MKQTTILFILIISIIAVICSKQTFAATPTPTLVPMADVGYTLAYPGLLPDNPLYFLKVLRDRFVGFFISDPLKRSAFDLLQSDKRISAAFYVSQEAKVNEPLVISTISKGENYFSDAIAQLRVASQQGELTGAQVGQLQLAGEKYLALFHDMSVNGSTLLKNDLRSQSDRLTQLMRMVKGIGKQ